MLTPDHRGFDRFLWFVNPAITVQKSLQALVLTMTRFRLGFLNSALV